MQIDIEVLKEEMMCQNIVTVVSRFYAEACNELKVMTKKINFVTLISPNYQLAKLNWLKTESLQTSGRSIVFFLFVLKDSIAERTHQS